MTSPPEGSAARAPIPGPLAFTGIVRASWRLYRPNAWTLVRLAFPILLAYSVASVLVADRLTIEGDEVEVVSALFTFAILILNAIVSSFIIAFSARVIDVRSTDAESEDGSDKPDAARSSVGFLIRNIFAASLLSAMVSLLLFVLGPIVIFIRDPLLGPPIIVHAIALERRTLYEAWARARFLLSGNWLRVFVYLLTLALGLILLYGLVIFGGTGWLERGPSSDPGLGFLLPIAIAEAVARSITLPFFATAMLVCYYDLRVRKGELLPTEPPADG